MYFQFEQLSIIPVLSLLLTFNKYAASGVLSFSIHHFHVSIYNQSGWAQVCIKWALEWKLLKQNNFIEKYATSSVRFCITVVNILQCGMSNRRVLSGDQEMIWKLGVCEWSGKLDFVPSHKSKKNNCFWLQ